MSWSESRASPQGRSGRRQRRLGWDEGVCEAGVPPELLTVVLAAALVATLFGACFGASSHVGVTSRPQPERSHPFTVDQDVHCEGWKVS